MARRVLCAVAVAACAVGFALVAPDVLIATYIALEAWNDGVNIVRAFKDACFTLAEVEYSVFKAIAHVRSKDYVVVSKDDDHVTQVCKTSLYLKTTEVSGPWPILDTPEGPTRDRLEAYVQACREVYATLQAGSRQRAVLEAFRPKPGVPVEVPNVTAPFYHGPMNPEELRAHVAMREKILESRPKVPAELLQSESYFEPAAAKPSLMKSPLKPVRPNFIEASDVAEALRRGEVAQFDATKLLPKELFNLSMIEIVKMHGDLARGIPVYRQRGPAAVFGAQSLAELGERFEAMQRADKLYHADQVPNPRHPEKLVPPQPKTWWLRWLRSLVLATKAAPDVCLANLEMCLHYLRRWLAQPTINARRLPKLPPIDLHGTLGSPEWLERVWSLLWCGAVGIWWHNDEPDNLLIALNGEMTVAVFQQNDTDLISGMRGPVHAFAQGFSLNGFHPDSVDKEWLEKNKWMHKVPYTRLHLKPGMGITVPSRTYHAIWAEDADRILLNAFMIPKYGAMEDAPPGKDSFFGRGRQDDVYMALLHLKFSSLSRMWDRRHLGGFFEVQKLEIF